MKLGLSSYSFRPLLANGDLTIESMFDWLAEHDAEHLEIATFSLAPDARDPSYDLSCDEQAIERLLASVARTGIPVSGLCLGANFLGTEAERQRQIDLVRRHVDLCQRLGAGFLRHDVVPWNLRASEIADLETTIVTLADASREVAEYAAARGVVTSVEDHGFFINASENLLTLVQAVDHSNFKLTVDIGNFLCVDDAPEAATAATLPHASFVHVKDFYVRDTEPGPGWLKTTEGRFIRGSVFGFGDLDARGLLRTVVKSGYDGFVSLEYEGNEPTLYGCEIGLQNLRRLLSEIRAA